MGNHSSKRIINYNNNLTKNIHYRYIHYQINSTTNQFYNHHSHYNNFRKCNNNSPLNNVRHFKYQKVILIKILMLRIIPHDVVDTKARVIQQKYGNTTYDGLFKYIIF